MYYLLTCIVAGARRPDTHLNSTDGEDDWQAVDNVSYVLHLRIQQTSK